KAEPQTGRSPPEGGTTNPAEGCLGGQRNRLLNRNVARGRTNCSECTIAAMPNWPAVSKLLEYNPDPAEHVPATRDDKRLAIAFFVALTLTYLAFSPG